MCWYETLRVSCAGDCSLSAAAVCEVCDVSVTGIDFQLGMHDRMFLLDVVPKRLCAGCALDALTTHTAAVNLLHTLAHREVRVVGISGEDLVDARALHAAGRSCVFGGQLDCQGRLM